MSTPAIITWLDTRYSIDVAEVGAKAANLTYLSNDWPIPEGFCVTTSAYRRFVHTNRLDNVLDISKFVGRTEHELDSYCQYAQVSILSGKIPEDVSSAIKIAYQRLQHNCESYPIGIAIRSSSTVEDLEQTSFSGVFETFLNIIGYDALLLHVKKCWASLWNVAALTWMMESGFMPDSYAMAVIVERMVKAESSGVMFTANPISGNPFEVVINSTWGLGEGVVSGRIETDTFVVDEFELCIKTRRIADKEAMISGSPSGGTSVQPVDQRKKAVSSLREEQVIRLAQMGVELQRHFGRPQDVEWAIQDGTVYVLQTRPIVGLPSFFPVSGIDQQGPPHSTWYLEFREHFSPFGRSLEHLKNPVYSSALGRAIGVKIRKYQITINGYIYHSQMVEKPTYIPLCLFQAWQLLRWFILARNTDLKFREETIPGFIHRMTEIKTAISKAENLEELLHQLDKAIKNYLVFQDESVLPNILANAFCTLVMRFFNVFWKDDNSFRAVMLFSGLPNKTVERDAGLMRLIDLAKDEGLLPLFNGSHSLPEVIQQLKGSSSGQKFLCEFERFREEFGYVWADGSTKDPGWQENNALIFSIFREKSHRLKLDDVGAESFSHNIMTRLGSSWIGRLVPFHRQCFEKLVVLARRYYPHREDHNYYCSSGVMLIRKIVLACGEWLVRSGMMNEAEAIFQLAYEEIIKLPQSIEEGTFSKYIELIHKRRVEGERQKRLIPPGTIVLGCVPISPTVIFSNARQLTGVPGSPGIARGPARVVNRAELGRVHAGDILICDNFRPEWSPVLRYIRGLVTNRGYMLSHGANLAREWGIPAVMGVHIATQAIGDGDIVEVDGSRGLVQVELAARWPARWKDG